MILTRTPATPIQIIFFIVGDIFWSLLGSILQNSFSFLGTHTIYNLSQSTISASYCQVQDNKVNVKSGREDDHNSFE